MKRVSAFIFASAFVFSLAIINITAPIAANASAAFSRGDGSAESPYGISECAQLHSIDDNLDKHFELLVNIDCSSEVSFIHLAEADSFSGVLEGGNHVISGLHIDNYGLFKLIVGGTVQNLKIEGSPIETASDYVGSLAGIVTAGTIINVHSTIDVDSTGNFIGGLVGGISSDMNNNASNLLKSSYKGNVRGLSAVGGLTSSAGGTTNILNTYSTGTVISNFPGGGGGQAIGGFIGSAGGGFTVMNSYTTAAVTVTGGTADANGAFIGVAGSGDIEASFADGSISSTATNKGDFIGQPAGITINANYFADHGNGCGPGIINSGCQAVNVGGTPNYFKVTSNNPYNGGGFGPWDFNNIWAIEAGQYPHLIGEDGFEGVAGPNNGDANGDSIDDSYQANVMSVPDGNNIYTTVEINADSNCTLSNGAWIDSNYYKVDSGFVNQIPNMTSFNVNCPTPGAQVQVTLIYPGHYDTSKSVVRFYNVGTNSYHTVAGATFGTRTISSIAHTTATYTLVDGGVNDSDGAADGIIHDPVGIASDTSIGGGASNNNSNKLSATGQRELSPVLVTLSAVISGIAILYLYRRPSRYSHRR